MLLETFSGKQTYKKNSDIWSNNWSKHDQSWALRRTKRIFHQARPNQQTCCLTSFLAPAPRKEATGNRKCETVRTRERDKSERARSWKKRAGITVMIPSISRHHPQMSASDDTDPDVSDTTPLKNQQGHTHTQDVETAMTTRVCPLAGGFILYIRCRVASGSSELITEEPKTTSVHFHTSVEEVAPPAGLRSLAIWRINRVWSTV